MLVLRDYVNGDCYVVDFKQSELDLERLDYADLEVAGEVINLKSCETDNQLQFTSCENINCKRWILIIDDFAPENCAEHTESEE
jgi:hypothetical protein